MLRKKRKFITLTQVECKKKTNNETFAKTKSFSFAINQIDFLSFPASSIMILIAGLYKSFY